MFNTVERKMLSSKGDFLFSPLWLALSFLVGIFILGFYSFAVWVLLFLKKTLEVNVDAKTFKNGLFSKWKRLPDGGYISLMSHSSGQKISSRVSTTVVSDKDLKLFYIHGRERVHIYSPNNAEDANDTALYLGNKWGIGVFEPRSKTWLKPKP